MSGSSSTMSAWLIDWFSTIIVYTSNKILLVYTLFKDSTLFLKVKVSDLITRFKVAALHLLFSGIVVGLAMSVVYFIWYPYPYYIFHSTISATKLVVMVDLIIGPLLTFVVFNVAKSAKELTLDLMIIILVQISALSWGMYVTHSVRPIFSVYFDGEINSISAVSIDNSGFDKSIHVPGVFSPLLPVYIKPFSRDEYRSEILKMMRGQEMGTVLQTRLYRTVDDAAKKDMRSRSLTEEQLTRTEKNKEKLNAYLEANKLKFADVLYFPVSAGPYSGVAIVDKSTLKIIDHIEMYVKNTSDYIDSR